MSAYMNQYRQNQIETASPEQILLMLYDGAIRFTRQAISGLESEDLGAMRYGIQKSMAIVTEFSNSLDHEIGGQIAEDLDGLYGFMIRELTHCNINPDVKKLQDVEKILVDLRATWGEAVDINRQEQATANANTKTPVEEPTPTKPTATGTYGATGYGGNTVSQNYTPLSVSS